MQKLAMVITFFVIYFLATRVLNYDISHSFSICVNLISANSLTLEKLIE